MKHRIAALLGLLGAAPTAAAHEAAGAAQTAPAVAPTWTLAALASLVMAATFLAIAAWMWRAILDGDQLTSNPLLTGMALIFTTCAVGHLLHFEHTILPLYAPAAASWLGLGDVAHAVGFGRWARIAMTDPIVLGTDVVTAIVAVWYFTLRHKQRAVLRGAELADDIEVREQQAHLMHDSIVQTVAEAKLLLEMGRPDEAEEAIQEALEESQEIVDSFLDAPGGIEPGELRRVDVRGG